MAGPVTIPLEQLNQTIRDRLKARGATTIKGLALRFKIMDDNGNKMLDRYELSKALTEIGITVNKMV
jgi:hypothetical protein